MEFQLSVNWNVHSDDKRPRLRSKISLVLAEIELDNLPEWPKLVAGKFADVSIDQLNHLASAKAVILTFKGRPYEIDTIEADSTFRLRRTW